MELILFVIGVVAFLWMSRRITKVQIQVERLSKRISAQPEGNVSGERAPVSSPDTMPTGSYQPQTFSSTRPQPQGMYASHEERMGNVQVPFDRFIAWLKKDWLMKLGGFLMLIALGSFVTYAFLQNWIGPVGRITLGLVAGAGVMAFSVWWMKKQEHQGGVLLLVGTGTIMMTMWSARFVYEFFTPVSALGIMLLAVVCAAVTSVLYRSPWVAWVSLAFAGLIPLLIEAARPDYVMLFAYLLVIVVGTVWVVGVTGWRSLTLTALGIVSLYSLVHWVDAPYGAEDVRGILLFISFIFASIFFISNVSGILYARNEQDTKYDLIAAVGTGFFLLFWILAVVPEHFQSLLLAAWMIVFTTGGFITFQQTNHRIPLMFYSAVAMMYLAAATTVELEGPALLIAYTVEIGVLSYVASRVFGEHTTAEYLALLYAVPAALSLEYMTSYVWRDSIIHAESATLIVLMGALAVSGGVFVQKRRAASQMSEAFIPLALLVVSSAYLYALIWLMTHTLVAADVAVGISLTVYTLVGLGTYIVGGLHENTWLRIYGGALLGCVVARLLFVDVWEMAISGRIIVFFLIGALLIGAAFIGRDADKSDESVT